MQLRSSVSTAKLIGRLFPSSAFTVLAIALSMSVSNSPTFAGEPATGSGDKAARQTRVTAAPYYWSWWGWEPLEHNVRLGAPSYTVDGGAWWAPKWYDRLHSEELVQKMAKLGVNLAVTHFYKGFGLESERPQWQRTAALVRVAHKHGVKVLGYCQFASLYYETFLAEEPRAEDWGQRSMDGGFKPYEGAQYYRWRPCFNNPDFRAYVKRTVRVGLKEVGLDGFNFDNCLSGPCYCGQCTTLFRAWLAKRYPDPLPLFGIPSFNHVRQPPAPAKAEQIHDPLVRAWIRWRCECLGGFVKEITAYARSLQPDVILMANPAHPCGASDTALRSVWPVWVGRHLNLMITENANSPEIDGDLMVSQIRAHKNAAAIGYRAVPTTWAEGRGRQGATNASTRLPQTAVEIHLQVAEAAANGGVPGANWATRALGGGDGMRIDRPEFSEALSHYLGFVHQHESLIFSAHPVNDVAVLHAFPSLAFNGQYAMDQIAAAEEVLIRSGFQWGVLFDDNLQQLDEFSVLVLAGQSHLSNATCTAVKQFVERGGSVVMLGENGKYDDEGRLLEANRLDGLAGKHVSRLKTSIVRRIKDRHWGVFATLPPAWKEIADTILKAADRRLSARLIDADTTVALSACRGEANRLVVHLVNYAAPRPTRHLQVEIGRPWSEHAKVRLLSPGVPERTLSLRRNGAHSIVDVPPLEVYGILVVE
ncbi:MAG: alpha-amylase family protein [Verrucomicrobiia bacterium]